MSGVESLFPGCFESDDVVGGHVGGDAFEDAEPEVCGVSFAEESVAAVA